MQSLSQKQIRSFASQAAEACACALASGDEPFFKHLEWWLADGAFNHEPFGMFRTDQPYRPDDNRTVEQFLDQETRHRWDGMHKLKDLFSQQVSEMLEAWARKWLAAHPGAPVISDEQWEQHWSQEWEEALFEVNLNPRVHASAWDEFLCLPMATIVERWREHAARVASSRALSAARMVSRQALEAAIIERVADELAHQRREHPASSTLEHFQRMAATPSSACALELAVYAHSSAFTRRLPAAELGHIQQAFPLPRTWLEVGERPQPVDQPF